MIEKKSLSNNFKIFCSYIKSGIWKKLMLKLIELSLSGIVLAVVASLLTANIIEYKEQKRTVSNQLDALSNIYIGCNKQWVDQVFGYPQFTGEKEEYLLCAYINNYFVLQIVFDSAQSTQAYLITALDNPKKINIEINDGTIQNGVILGELSYYDFPGSPYSIFDFVSNGNGRALYSESYYFMGGGNYYDYHIASLDYGKRGKNIEGFMSDLDFSDDKPVDDEVIYSKNSSNLVLKDRKNNYPNSYGVSNEGIDMSDLLFSYDWFNSQQLRNKLDISSGY